MAGVTLVNILMICQIFMLIDCTNNATGPPKSIKLGDIVMGASTRIVGGKPTSIKHYPYVVSIQWRVGNHHHCGGTYIMPKFVLSAAHCMVKFSGYYWRPENPRFFIVVAGTTNLWYSSSWQIMRIDSILPHARFNFETMANDIGLFKLTDELRITTYVNYAPIPYAVDSNLFKNDTQICTVVGWGKTSETSSSISDILRRVDVPLMSNRECRRYYSDALHVSNICAGRVEGGIDACQGDSGGPLVLNGVQIGIVSWGHGCAAPYSPGVYVRVDYYLSWITRTVQRNNASSSVLRDPSMIILTCFFSISLLTQ